MGRERSLGGRTKHERHVGNPLHYGHWLVSQVSFDEQVPVLVCSELGVTSSTSNRAKGCHCSSSPASSACWGWPGLQLTQKAQRNVGLL